MEQLETRIMPAGTVTAAISNRVLTIKGDTASNTIDLYQTGYIDEYRLVGNATTLKVNNVTKGFLSFNMNNVDVINISMGDGHDNVFVRGVNSGYGDFDTPKGLKIETGAGNDRLVLKYVNVWENDLNVLLGSGVDTLDASYVKVDESDFLVDMSSSDGGTDYVKIVNSNVGDDLTVQTALNGNKRVTLESTTVGDLVKVDLSNGVDVVNLNKVNSKRLDVNLWSGNDKLNIKASKFTQSASLLGGGGNANQLNLWNNVGESGWSKLNFSSITKKDLFFT